jgi:hypothetical protein
MEYCSAGSCASGTIDNGVKFVQMTIRDGMKPGVLTFLLPKQIQKLGNQNRGLVVGTARFGFTRTAHAAQAVLVNEFLEVELRSHVVTHTANVVAPYEQNVLS